MSDCGCQTRHALEVTDMTDSGRNETRWLCGSCGHVWRERPSILLPPGATYTPLKFSGCEGNRR